MNTLSTTSTEKIKANYARWHRKGETLAGYISRRLSYAQIEYKLHCLRQLACPHPSQSALIPLYEEAEKLWEAQWSG